MRYFLLAAALVPAGIYAAPLDRRDTVSASQLATFTLFSQYAGASYCFNNVHQNGAVTCASEGGDCPLVEATGATIVNNFQAGKTKTLGFVAVDNTNKLVVVSIQGTQIGSNPVDVITDGDIIQQQTTLCGTANTHDGCAVHQGFFDAAQDAAPLVIPAVQAATAANPGYGVVVTGHSLGAAVAALLGTQMRNQGMTVDMYTFGQPKLGNADISNFVQGQAPALGNNFRVTHFNDVVPQLPEHEWNNTSWDHYYPEFWINLKDGAPSTSDMVVVGGSLFETGGNEGTNSVFGPVGDVAEGGLTAHGLYFQKIAGCSSDAPGSKSLSSEIDGFIGSF